jgi:methylmalonyl-CoA/ethylmalonyl-CoA epimerase
MADRGVLGVDHIGVAVRSLDEAGRFYRDLGIATVGEETVAGQKGRVALYPVGETRVELLESTEPDGPIGKFVEKKGPGLHHVALQVKNLEETLRDLAAKGYDLIDKVPRSGAGGHRIAFVHPKSTGGVLLELVEASHEP